MEAPRAERETEKVLMSQREKAYEGLRDENERLKLAVLESQKQENQARKEQSRKKGEIHVKMVIWEKKGKGGKERLWESGKRRFLEYSENEKKEDNQKNKKKQNGWN